MRNLSLLSYVKRRDWSWGKIENFHFSFWSFLYGFTLPQANITSYTLNSLKYTKRKPKEKHNNISIPILCRILKIEKKYIYIFIYFMAIMFY